MPSSSPLPNTHTQTYTQLGARGSACSSQGRLVHPNYLHPIVHPLCPSSNSQSDSGRWFDRAYCIEVTHQRMPTCASGRRLFLCCAPSQTSLAEHTPPPTAPTIMSTPPVIQTTARLLHVSKPYSCLVPHMIICTSQPHLCFCQPTWTALQPLYPSLKTYVLCCTHSAYLPPNSVQLAKWKIKREATTSIIRTRFTCLPQTSTPEQVP